MLKDDKRDVWLEFLAKLILFSSAVEIARKLARVLTRSRPVILAQPESKTVTDSQSATLRVVADNVSSYQWQYLRDGQTTWQNSTGTGNKTDSLLVSTAYVSTRYLNQYRCKITGLNDEVIYTVPVRIIRKED